MKRANLLSLVAQMEGIKRRPPDAEPEFPSIFSRLRGFCHHKCRGRSSILIVPHSHSDRAKLAQYRLQHAKRLANVAQSSRAVRRFRTLLLMYNVAESFEPVRAYKYNLQGPSGLGTAYSLRCKSRCGRGCSSAHVCARAGRVESGRPELDCAPTPPTLTRIDSFAMARVAHWSVCSERYMRREMELNI